MPKRIIVIALILGGAACYGQQLHLLTAAPDEAGLENYPMNLVRIEVGGRVREPVELIGASAKVEWVDAHHEWRKAVIITTTPKKNVAVLDFNTATITKSCNLPGSDLNYVKGWLAESPVGQQFEWLEFVDADPATGVTKGMLLDPGVPCERSFSDLKPEAIKSVVISGEAGAGGVVSRSLSGGLWPGSGGGDLRIAREVNLDYRVPESLWMGPGSAWFHVNNPDVFAIGVNNRITDQQRTLVFRKSDHTWHPLPVSSERPPYLRAFGKYLVITEALREGRNVVYPGMAKMKMERKTGPAFIPQMQYRHMVLPGRLHIYNVESERIFRLTTNQADTEVLLIENGTVYYRVNDELWAVPFTDAGLGKARLLATDDSIIDAHWAFTKN